jgi:uncharacterized membrane protein YtjA (UPF0391 family)
MFNWTITFLIIAIVAGLLGFTTIAGAAIGMAKIIFFISLAIWLIAVITVSKSIKK